MQRPTGGLEGISDLLERAKVRNYGHRVCVWGSLTGVRFSMTGTRLTCQRTVRCCLLPWIVLELNVRSIKREVGSFVV
jgi:hypothetical protein